MANSYNDFSNDAYTILKKATMASRKFYHTFCGTPHLFLSLFSFLREANVNQNERYIPVWSFMKNEFDKYGINGSTFKECFLKYFAEGVEPAPGSTFECTTDREYMSVVNNLKRKALQEERAQEVEDLIMELFSDKSFTLYTIISDIAGGDDKADTLYDAINRKFIKKVAREIADLEEISELTNLNKYVAEHPITAIGSDDPVSQIEMALSGRSINSAILVGPAGTGKTTFVYEFVQRVNEGNVPDHLKDLIIYQLDPASLIAGTKFRGEFEQKLTNIIDVVKTKPNVVLFIDEGHMLVNLGDSTDGSTSAGNIIKPYITRGELRMILATTNDEYTKHILPNKAFARRFHEVKINEPSKEETREILIGLLPVETEFFSREIQLELVDRIVDLANKYSLELANPAKSINMLELACAYSKVFEEKNTEVIVNDIIQSIRLKYDIYISENKYADTEASLSSYILGQDNPIKQICRNLKIVERNIVDKDRPLMSMMFCGSTGVGKTEACKIIARNFFGSENNLIKINCGEYSDQTATNKLTGASAGYIGYDEEPELISQIRQHPNSLVLFDEIEKAHPDVMKILLNILDSGEMTDNKGNHVSFRNAIIIFTTNLGCTHNTGKNVGMGVIKTVEDKDRNIMSAIKGFFTPEFLGRMDDIVMFNSLTNDIAETLIERYRKQYCEAADIDVQLNEDDIKAIIKDAKIETAGARGLKRAVRKQLVVAEERENA